MKANRTKESRYSSSRSPARNWSVGKAMAAQSGSIDCTECYRIDCAYAHATCFEFARFGLQDIVEGRASNDGALRAAE